MLSCICPGGSKAAPGEGQGVEQLPSYAQPDTGLGRESRGMKAEQQPWVRYRYLKGPTPLLFQSQLLSPVHVMAAACGQEEGVQLSG